VSYLRLWLERNLSLRVFDGGGAVLKAEQGRQTNRRPKKYHVRSRNGFNGAATTCFHSNVALVLPFLEERISFKMPSDVAYLDQVLDYLNDHMLKLGIIGPDDSEILVALDEAIVNAIKHGNKGDTSKQVHVVAEISADGARFTIRDEGSGFVRDGVPDPTDPVRLLVPSGRGLLLINHIMDHVTHNECGNEIRMLCRSRRS
jgi:serine/threonine-protein kinase RsbW